MAGRERDDSDTDVHDVDRDRIERLRTVAREKWGDDADDLDAIESLLESDDADERARGAWALAELAADDADRSARLPIDSKLAPLFDDEDRWVRRGASWAVATIADRHPQRARAALAEVTESLADEDPLVRENGVLALSDVAREYPRSVEPALSLLADLVRNDEGLAGRYAAETLRDLVTQLDEDGFPETIEATADLADLLGGETDVVTVIEDSSNDRSIRVRGGSADPVATEDDERADEPDEESSGPPERIPAPPEIAADRRDFERLADLGGGPLTTATKARVSARAEGSQHVVVTLRTLRSDVDAARTSVESAFRAWSGVDDHDHVAPILARGTDPRPWIAVEFMDGGTLRRRLGSIGFDRATWYAHCVTAAVCHAHAHGVVHGALGPGAVGLSRTLGAWSIPKVGDWGFGELFREVESRPVPPAYAAPEHVVPEEFGRPDHSTDVYQLGALCYALFAGRPPFTGDPPTVARKVRNETPAPASEFAPRLPSDIDDLLGRALTKEKRARFETAEDFRRELELVARDASLPFEL